VSNAWCSGTETNMPNDRKFLLATCSSQATYIYDFLSFTMFK
jgi:hypothetical protein